MQQFNRLFSTKKAITSQVIQPLSTKPRESEDWSLILVLATFNLKPAYRLVKLGANYTSRSMT